MIGYIILGVMFALMVWLGVILVVIIYDMRQIRKDMELINEIRLGRQSDRLPDPPDQIVI